MEADIRKPKLSGKQRMFVCSLIAAGYNSTRIVQELKETFDIQVTIHNIWANYVSRKKWQPIIARFRDKFDKELIKHPLMSKTNRLNIVKEALGEAMTWRLDKVYYDKEGNEISRVEKRQLGAIAALIREARAEVEGDKPLIDNSKHYHFGGMTDEQIIKLAGEKGVGIPDSIQGRMGSVLQGKQI